MTSNKKRLVNLACLIVFFFGLSYVSNAQDEEKIYDLQEILQSVSTTMNGFHEILRSVSATLNDVKVALKTRSNSTKEVSNDKKPRDCADLWHSGIKSNGVYRVWPERWEKVGSFEVYCDMVTDGGGWTVFQKRGDYGLPIDFFFKTWNEYKNGFGQLDKEFWLGNDRIFALTNQDTYELRIDLWDMVNKVAHAKYNKFWLENEDQRYKLKLSGYSGDAGDDLSGFSGIPFTTKDRDHDTHPEANCAEVYKGGWWYTKCHSANLNGLNLRGPHKTYADGIEWNSFRGHYYSLAASEMKIRPVGFMKHM